MCEQLSVSQLIDQGVALEEQGRLDEALQCIDRALCHDEGLGRAHFLRANILGALDRLTEALASYDRALELKPDSVGAHFNRGGVCERMGHLDDAERAIRRALSLKPEFVDAWIGLGNVLRSKGCQKEALDCFREAMHLDPGHAEVHLNAASVLLALGDTDFAEQHLMRCIQMKPSYAEGVLAYAGHLNSTIRQTEAIALLQEALVHLPRHPVLLETLARTYLQIGCYRESEAAFRDILAFAPADGGALNGLGTALSASGRFQEAEACFRKAIESERGVVGEALCNLATALYSQRRYQEAISVYEHHLNDCPDDTLALSNLALLRVEIGQVDEALRIFWELEQRSAAASDAADALSHWLFVRHYLNPISLDVDLADERRYGALVASLAKRYQEWNCECLTSRVIRVGLVSPDLRDHPVGYFVQNVLQEMAQRRPVRIQFHVYSNTHQSDETSARIRASCASWVVVSGLSDAQFAERVHDDRIDILVDLSGHTGSHRLPVFSWKPAPVQVTWLGYFGTTGVSEIDYLIADPWTVPDGQTGQFVESVWRLPETRLCFSAPDYDLQVSELPALQNGFVTLGSFNSLPKINDEVVAAWSEIMKRVAGAKLIVKCKQMDDSWLRRETAARFQACGVLSDQLILEGSSSRKVYLERYSAIDIILDPFPYPGGTTTVEALWMGVPVLSMNGERFLARQGVGLLANAGLSAWVATDATDYVAKAVAYSSSPTMLAQTRAGLRDQIRVSPIFDAARFSEHFESALCEMWRRRCASEREHARECPHGERE